MAIKNAFQSKYSNNKKKKADNNTGAMDWDSQTCNASFSEAHEEQREPAEGQSTLSYCKSAWRCVMIIRITSSRIMELKHIQASMCAVPKGGPVCCEYSAFKWSIRSQTNTDRSPY